MAEILTYHHNLKPFSRTLRRNMTDAERMLWQRIRKKQIHNIQFYTQKPMGPYILDFYSKKPKIAIEIDGGQHFEPSHQEKDQSRDMYLKSLGITVLRFTNLEVLNECPAVLSVIESTILKLLPPC